MNTISIIGRISQDIELKSTQNGISVCSFSVAVKRPHVKEVTDFLPCVAWRQTAEFISKYFAKGQMIAIVGTLTTRKYQDQYGNNRTAYEILIDSVDFCGDKPTTNQNNNAENNQSTNSNQPNTYPEFMEVQDEDLPF